MTSYVEKTLGNGESLIYTAHFNWTYSFWSFAILIFSLIPVPVLAYITVSEGLSLLDLRAGWVCAAIAAFLGAFLFLLHMIKLWTTEIAVTTFRFVYKTGLISRNTKEVSLNKIEEITLNQSVWGRLFGYGSLTLRGTGVGVIKLPNIDEPIRVRKIIENAKSAMRTGETTSQDNLVPREY